MSLRDNKYVWNVLTAVSQLGNALLNGDRNETISSRLGKMKRANGGKIPEDKRLWRVVERVIVSIDPNHFQDAIEEDKGEQQHG